MKILIIDSEGLRFERNVAGYWLDGRCITLFSADPLTLIDGEPARSEIAAFWDIKGFEVLEEE